MKGPFPTKFLEKIAPEQRRVMGNAGLTVADVDAKLEHKAERTMQDQMEGLCRQRDISYVRQPMHKKTTAPLGYPDFTIFCLGGRVVLVEVKTDTGQLSEDQIAWWADHHRKTGCAVELVRSVQQFRTLLDSLVHLRLLRL